MKWTFLISLFVLLISCEQQGSKDRSKAKENKEALNNVDSADKAEVEIEPGIAQRLEEQKNDLDSIQLIVQVWNEAINNKDYSLLRSLYMPNIKFYLKEYTAAGVISKKRGWLDKNPDYKQEVLRLQIQYPTDDNENIRCVFNKVIHTPERIDTVSALLELKLIAGEYRIHKESDQASEIMLYRNPTKQEPPTSARFTHDYWLDTREDVALAHSFVPYYMVLSYNEQDTSFYWYSGSLRCVRDFYIKDFNSGNGYLTFEAAPIWDGREGEIPKDDEFMFFRFAIHDNELAFVEHKNGWFDELLGIRLWRTDEP